MRKATLFLLTLTSLSLFGATTAHQKMSCHFVQACNDKHQCHKRRICAPKNQSWIEAGLISITGSGDSALEKRLEKENRIERSHYGITFDEPTYVLPFYYTGNPDQNIGPTPNNQSIKNAEFKAQFSFKFPIWGNIYGSNWGIAGSYTQLSYWQFYSKSQFFRETNYEPALYARYHFFKNWLMKVGLMHESNGRGGTYERSWNRAYMQLSFSGKHWLVMLNPWLVIFKKESSDLHNPDITKYLGDERFVVAYKYHTQEWSAMVRNSFESGFKRTTIELNYAFPIHGILRGYVQYFHGYGQSLIEYKQKTNSAGIGITLSNWL